MAKYDEQLDRMSYLMEYKVPKAEVKGNIEYHANGADGKVYGILKEGTKYYIKTTEQGKENLAESYDYINGFNNRRENEFKSYNDATKHLELKLMSLNEAHGKHEDVSTVDFKRNEKVLANLTEEARKELDRMHEIFENSMNIGKNNVGDPESKGKASPENTTKNNEPFEKKVTPDMDFKGSNGTVKGATENSDVKGVDADLQSDKMKTKNSGSEKDYKDAHDDLDGEGVADKKPAGGKVVRVNEGFCEGEFGMEDNSLEEPALDDEPMLGDEEGTEVDGGDLSADDFEPDTNMVGGEEEPVGLGDDEIADEPDEFDALLEELENATSSKIVGPEKTLDGPHGSLDVQTWDKMKGVNEAEVEGPDEDVMKNEKNDDKKLDVQSWDKMNEMSLVPGAPDPTDKGDMNNRVELATSMLESIVNEVYNKLIAESQMAKLQKTIKRLVNEEVTKLDAWGKHPKYGKPFMSLPPNKEVLAGTADRDFNDDSAKGEEVYGKKIGDGEPFEKVVTMLTDQVMSQLKESLRK